MKGITRLHLHLTHTFESSHLLSKWYQPFSSTVEEYVKYPYFHKKKVLLDCYTAHGLCICKYYIQDNKYICMYGSSTWGWLDINYCISSKNSAQQNLFQIFLPKYSDVKWQNCYQNNRVPNNWKSNLGTRQSMPVNILVHQFTWHSLLLALFDAKSKRLRANMLV